MWPNFSYRGVRSVQLLLLLLLLMVFSSENFGFSPPYAGIAGIGPDTWAAALWFLAAITPTVISELLILKFPRFIKPYYACAKDSKTTSLQIHRTYWGSSPQQEWDLVEQGQILQYNSISRFGSHLNSKRLADTDKRNSLKQKLKTNEAAKLPWNQYGELSFGAGEGRFLRDVMCS